MDIDKIIQQAERVRFNEAGSQWIKSHLDSPEAIEKYAKDSRGNWCVIAKLLPGGVQGHALLDLAMRQCFPDIVARALSMAEMANAEAAKIIKGEAEE